MTEQVMTERQAFWFEHLRRCEHSGEPLTVYAAAHSLSVSSLYEAKSRLKRRGLVDGDGRPGPKFVQVAQLQPASPTACVCRVRFANGVLVELEVGAGELERVLHSVAAVA